MIASITGIFSSSLFIPLDCMLDTRGFPSCVPQSRGGYLSYPRGGWSSCSSFFLLNKYTMSYFKGKLSQFVVNRQPRYIFKQIFPYTLDINVMFDRSPGLRASGLDHVFRAVQVLFLFFLEKEDNNPCIAFLKARLTCH